MACSDPVDYVNINKTEDVYLKNFISTERSWEETVRFRITNGCKHQFFHVTVYSNGIDPKSRGYVSVVVKKPILGRFLNWKIATDSLSWTLSIVDVDHVARYYQSFYKENVEDQDYEINVPDFLKRSVILERSDEFLPDDVLTVRCELSCMSYAGPPSDSKWWAEINILDYFKLSRHPKCNTDILLSHSHREALSETGYRFEIEYDLKKLINDLQNIVSDVLQYRVLSFSNPSKIYESTLSPIAATDNEIKNTYLGFNPLFKAYMLLKEKLKKSVNSPPNKRTLHKDSEYFHTFSQINFHKLWKTVDVRLVIGEQDESSPISACWSWSLEIERKSLNHRALSGLDGECWLVSGQQNERRSTVQMDKVSVRMIDELQSGTVEEISDTDDSIENITREKGMNENPEDSCEIENILLEKGMKENPEDGCEPENKTREKGMNENLEDGRRHEKSMKLKVPNEHEVEGTYVKESIETLKEAIKYLLSEEIELQGHAFCCEERNFVVETMEGTTFAIPFEEGRETIGSKLIAASPVFERMLSTPMQEKRLKRVKLSDISFRTFVHFLLFLHAGQRQFETFYDSYDLYKMGDQYDIPYMMRSCADNMVSFFSSRTIDVFEALAVAHSDDYFLYLVNSFKGENILAEATTSDLIRNNIWM